MFVTTFNIIVVPTPDNFSCISQSQTLLPKPKPKQILQKPTVFFFGTSNSNPIPFLLPSGKQQQLNVLIDRQAKIFTYSSPNILINALRGTKDRPKKKEGSQAHFAAGIDSKWGGLE